MALTALAEMLYDVLPPLVFFASLGGIILVVSRVVLRIRKEQFADSLQATMHRARAARSSKIEDLAQIIGPSKKSVRVIKNRIALINHAVQNNAARFGTSIQALGGKSRQALTNKIVALKEFAAERRAAKLKKDKVSSRTSSPTKPKLTAVETKPSDTTQQEESKTKRDDVISSQNKKKFFAKKKVASPLKQARQALDTDNHEKAEDVLVPYLAKHPKETRAYMMLGEIAMARHDWEEAMEVFEQVVSLDPRAKGGYAGLGRAALEAGKFTRAIEALQRAHDADPSNTTIIRQLLKIARRMDNAPMQHSLLEELLAIRRTQRQSQSRQSTPAQWRAPRPVSRSRTYPSQRS